MKSLNSFAIDGDHAQPLVNFLFAGDGEVVPSWEDPAFSSFFDALQMVVFARDENYFKFKQFKPNFFTENIFILYQRLLRL